MQAVLVKSVKLGDDVPQVKGWDFEKVNFT